MKNLRKNLLLASLIACACGSASAVGVLNEFQVNETVLPGSAGSISATTFTADKFTASYVERFQVTGVNTFATTAFFNVSSFSANDGSSNVNPIGLNAAENITIPNVGTFNNGGYRLYGVFSATGSYSNGPSGVVFTGGAATFSLFADTGSNTTVGFNANPNDLTFTGLGGGDDYLLATSELFVAGEGRFNPVALDNGSFAILFDGLDGTAGTSGLTALGKQYFFDPSPFYAVVKNSGQFATFILPGIGQTAQFTGSLDVQFENRVPEPSSVALVGLALVGLGLSRRKLKSA